MEIIQSLYCIINKLIGDDEVQLKYKRVESGTFELYLAGCWISLKALFEIARFIYKIVSTRIKIVLLKITSFSPFILKKKLAKSIANDLVNIDFELKKNKII